MIEKLLNGLKSIPSLAVSLHPPYNLAWQIVYLDDFSVESLCYVFLTEINILWPSLCKVIWKKKIPKKCDGVHLSWWY